MKAGTPLGVNPCPLGIDWDLGHNSVIEKKNNPSKILRHGNIQGRRGMENKGTKTIYKFLFLSTELLLDIGTSLVTHLFYFITFAVAIQISL